MWLTCWKKEKTSVNTANLDRAICHECTRVVSLILVISWRLSQQSAVNVEGKTRRQRENRSGAIQIDEYPFRKQAFQNIFQTFVLLANCSTGNGR